MTRAENLAVAAYNSSGFESAPSGEIVYLVPGISTLGLGSYQGAPLNLQFPTAPGQLYDVEYTLSLDQPN